MAKIHARNAHQLAAFSTERTRTDEAGHVVLYRERWVVRSDGKVLHRIVWVDDPTYHGYDPKHPHRLTFTSGHSIKGAIPKDTADRVAWFEDYLTRKGYDIVKQEGVR